MPPVLSHPDPARQVVVEVDDSDEGVGAVLSRNIMNNKLHPSAFFSQHLSPTKQNYDMGNCELLALVLALQEWRHWLEGAAEPFIVWMDHKNLAQGQYLHRAKQLNRRAGGCSWASLTGPRTVFPD